MNKEFLTVFVIVLVLLVGAINYSNPLHDFFLEGLNNIKKSYWESVESVEETIDEHFTQQKTIQELREQVEIYKKDRLLLQSIASELNALLAASKAKVNKEVKVRLSRAISYAKFGDRNKVWLDMEDYNTSKMYGLIRNGKTAGIVIEKLSKPLALLNHDAKSSYAVYIGENKAPGIARGKNSGEMIVEFIPTWIKIAVGDEVKTSGMDHLFYEGIPVGKVLKIQKKQGFQTATIQPFANTEDLGYFHVIEQL
ncbi:MAG: rod shape-determining protein MreC [Thiovulaceae bacterium]|nr:rod shape-determining protein MreC [Sulfurimonadaceae bacterium]